MAHVPAFYHMHRLTHVNLSTNRLGSNFEKLQEILDRPNSYLFLTQLNLSDNDLKFVPNCSNMPNLNSLDVSNNSIVSLETLKSKCLSYLIVYGNPFSILDFDPKKIPSLTKVNFGSDKCKFVRFAIVEKASEGEINFRITSQGEQNLMFPLPQILNNQKKLRELCQSAEISLGLFNTSDPKEQMKCLSRLAEDRALKYQCLNFTGDSFILC